MSDDTNLAHMSLTSPADPVSAPTVQPMAVTVADAAPVASVIPPPRPSTGVIQIPGLNNMVQGVRNMVAELRSSGEALKESAAALNSTMQEVKDRIDQTHEDLKFEIKSMGN